MEIITEAEYEEIPITNLDFGFAFGGTATWTLHPDDKLVEYDMEITLIFANGMVAHILKRNIAFWTKKDAILKRRLPKKAPVAQAAE